MKNCECFLKTIFIIYLCAFIVFHTLNFFNTYEEGFIDFGIMKKCNKLKRQCKARMTIIKQGATRSVNKRLQHVYNNAKAISKKIIFPKEIKISF